MRRGRRKFECGRCPLALVCPKVVLSWPIAVQRNLMQHAQISYISTLRAPRLNYWRLGVGLSVYLLFVREIWDNEVNLAPAVTRCTFLQDYFYSRRHHVDTRRHIREKMTTMLLSYTANILNNLFETLIKLGSSGLIKYCGKVSGQVCIAN